LLLQSLALFLLKGRKLLGIRVWVIFHEHGGHIREVWPQIVS
jgi:hypothetical protein